jgi:hypothetical protein
LKHKGTFLAGWRELTDEERDGEEEEDVCGDDTSTVVDYHEQ